MPARPYERGVDLRSRVAVSSARFLSTVTPPCGRRSPRGHPRGALISALRRRASAPPPRRSSEATYPRGHTRGALISAACRGLVRAGRALPSPSLVHGNVTAAETRLPNILRPPSLLLASFFRPFLLPPSRSRRSPLPGLVRAAAPRQRRSSVAPALPLPRRPRRSSPHASPPPRRSSEATYPRGHTRGALISAAVSRSRPRRRAALSLPPHLSTVMSPRPKPHSPTSSVLRPPSRLPTSSFRPFLIPTSRSRRSRLPGLVRAAALRQRRSSPAPSLPLPCRPRRSLPPCTGLIRGGDGPCGRPMASSAAAPSSFATASSMNVRAALSAAVDAMSAIR